MKTIEINFTKKVRQLLLPVLLIMLVNPLVGFVVALMILLNAPNDYDNNRNECITFFLAAAIWISLVNITKYITSDQYVYTNLFLRVPEKGFYGTVFQAWKGIGKEPFYGFITWCLYWLTGGSVRLFFFSLSLAIYLFMYFAVYKLYRAMNQPKGALLCSVLILTFFTQYFVMTLHLIRQMLAASIVIYAIVSHTVNGKNNWWLLSAAVLIHTSAFFFVLLSVIPWFYQPMRLRRICIVVGCFMPVILFNGFIADKLGEIIKIDAIRYGLSRYGHMGDSYGLVLSMGLMLVVFIPLTIASIKFLVETCSVLNQDEIQQKTDKVLEYESAGNWRMIFPIIYIFFLLMIFVISFTKSPVIQYRFFYFSYFFIPLLLPLMFVKPPLNRIYWSTSSLFFIIRFFVIHNTSGFKYAELPELLTQPITFYFTGNFHWMYL